MDTQNMQQTQNSISRLNAAITELLNALQMQKQNYTAALDSEKQKRREADEKAELLETQITTLQTENNDLKAAQSATQDTSVWENKVAELQREIEAKANRISGLQTEVQNLNNALNNRKTQIEKLTAENAELQQKISETTSGIDDIVLKLEKVLKENGAGNNND